MFNVFLFTRVSTDYWISGGFFRKCQLQGNLSTIGSSSRSSAFVGIVFSSRSGKMLDPQTLRLSGTLGISTVVFKAYHKLDFLRLKKVNLAVLKLNVMSGKGRGFVYQDGVHRRNPRDAPTWNAKTVSGVLASALILVVLGIIGFFYFIDPIEKDKAPVPEPVTLPCPAPNKTIGYTILAEDSMISTSYKYFFYAGRLSFAKAQKVCRDLPGGGDLVSITSSNVEGGINGRITGLQSRIFTNEQQVLAGMRKQVWTGDYLDMDLDGAATIRSISGSRLNGWHQNFCDRRNALRVISSAYEDFKKNDFVGSPLIYIVKDFRDPKPKSSGEPGCWQLYSSTLYDMERIEFNFVCQVPTEKLPFRFKRKFLGKFRPDANGNYLANEYAAFAGRGSFTLAQETCEKLAQGSQMLATNTLLRDSEVNKRVAHHALEIFGEDSGDPRRRPLIWTGGYFNLSSAYPHRVRWANDPNAVLDTPNELKYFGSSNERPYIYENFCGTIEYYEGIIDKALKEQRDSAKTTGCIKGRLFLIAKDYRDGQSVQGCWHVYDFDYLSRNDYELFLICQLRGAVEKNKENFHESEKVFSYQFDSKDP